jgi:SnoaL-like domain
VTTTPTSAFDDAPIADARGLVARYFRIWNDGDPAAVDRLVAADWIDHAHPDRTSPDDVRAAIEGARTARPGARVLIDAILGDGNLITVNGRIEHDEMTENRVWIVRVEDGLLREIWNYSAD